MCPIPMRTDVGTNPHSAARDVGTRGLRQVRVVYAPAMGANRLRRGNRSPPYR
jgi:hypothetical protein